MPFKSEYILFSIIYLTMLRGSETRSQNGESPCPDIFQYQYDQQVGLYGEIFVKIQPSRFLQVNVQMSIGNAVDGYNGKLELTNAKEAASAIENGEQLLYYLYFPVWHNRPPKITQILVNGNLVCSGPKFPTNSLPVITTVNLQHTLRINVQHLSAANVLPEDNDIPVRNRPHTHTQEDPEIFVYDLDDYGRPKQPAHVSDNNKFNFNPTVPPNTYTDRPFNPTVPPNRYTDRPFNPTVPPTRHTEPPRPQENPTDVSDVYKGNPFFTSGNTDYVDNTPRPTPNRRRPTQRIPPIIPPTVAPTLTAPDTSVDLAEDFDLASKDSIQSTRPFDDVCGQSLSTNHLIYDGVSVPRGAYPWLVAVFQVRNDGVKYICAGSLISDKHVITAAHCVETERKKLGPEEILLILGKLNIQKWIPTRGEKIVETESIIIHPDYESLTSDADIAILFLSERLQFTKYIRPVCLWRGDTDLNYIVGRSGTIVGWGKDEHGVLVTEEPKQTDLPIVSTEKCLASNLQFHYITSNRTFCAGFRNNTGPCNGDSGGGFMMKWEGRWMLRGIVSLSISEMTTKGCDLSNYVVFTDASKFMDWLISFIK